MAEERVPPERLDPLRWAKGNGRWVAVAGAVVALGVSLTPYTATSNRPVSAQLPFDAPASASTTPPTTAALVSGPTTTTTPPTGTIPNPLPPLLGT